MSSCSSRRSMRGGLTGAFSSVTLPGANAINTLQPVLIYTPTSVARGDHLYGRLGRCRRRHQLAGLLQLPQRLLRRGRRLQPRRHHQLAGLLRLPDGLLLGVLRVGSPGAARSCFRPTLFGLRGPVHGRNENSGHAPGTHVCKHARLEVPGVIPPAGRLQGGDEFFARAVRLDDPVQPAAGGAVADVLLLVVAGADGVEDRLVRGFVDLLPLALAGALLDHRERAGRLAGAHHGALGAGPGEGEERVEGRARTSRSSRRRRSRRRSPRSSARPSCSWRSPSWRRRG